MLKLSFWIGLPSLITYVATAYSGYGETILLFFTLSLVALMVAIIPCISGEKAKK